MSVGSWCQTPASRQEVGALGRWPIDPDERAPMPGAPSKKHPGSSRIQGVFEVFNY